MDQLEKGAFHGFHAHDGIAANTRALGAEGVAFSGNQLPYIDRVIGEHVPKKEIINDQLRLALMVMKSRCEKQISDH